MRKNVVLPQPLGPTTEMNSPRSTVETDAAQRFEIAERFRQARDGEFGGHA